MTTMVERVARAISGQDDAGWAALPENDRERLYGGGKWHDAGRTREDYRADARAAIAAMREPTENMANRGASSPLNMDSDVGYCAACRVWEDMIDAAVNEEPEA